MAKGKSKGKGKSSKKDMLKMHKAMQSKGHKMGLGGDLAMGALSGAATGALAGAAGGITAIPGAAIGMIGGVAKVLIDRPKESNPNSVANNVTGRFNYGGRINSVGSNLYGNRTNRTLPYNMSPQFDLRGTTKNKIFAGGGQMNPLSEINEGGAHEQNPNGGVPMGVAADGQPNLVEQGETILKSEDYVFSDRITNPKTGNTFAEDSKKYVDKERLNDPIAKRGAKKRLDQLMLLQENVKAIMERSQPTNQGMGQGMSQQMNPMDEQGQPQGMPGQGMPQQMDPTAQQGQQPMGAVGAMPGAPQGNAFGMGGRMYVGGGNLGDMYYDGGSMTAGDPITAGIIPKGIEDMSVDNLYSYLKDAIGYIDAMNMANISLAKEKGNITTTEGYPDTYNFTKQSNDIITQQLERSKGDIDTLRKIYTTLENATDLSRESINAMNDQYNIAPLKTPRDKKMSEELLNNYGNIWAQKKGTKTTYPVQDNTDPILDTKIDPGDLGSEEQTTGTSTRTPRNNRAKSIVVTDPKTGDKRYKVWDDATGKYIDNPNPIKDIYGDEDILEVTLPEGFDSGYSTDVTKDPYIAYNPDRDPYTSGGTGYWANPNDPIDQWIDEHMGGLVGPILGESYDDYVGRKEGTIRGTGQTYPNVSLRPEDNYPGTTPGTRLDTNINPGDLGPGRADPAIPITPGTIPIAPEDPEAGDFTVNPGDIATDPYTNVQKRDPSQLPQSQDYSAKGPLPTRPDNLVTGFDNIGKDSDGSYINPLIYAPVAGNALGMATTLIDGYDRLNPYGYEDTTRFDPNYIDMNQLTREVDRQAGRQQSMIRDASRGNIGQVQQLNQSGQSTMLNAAANTVLQGRLTNEQLRADSLKSSSQRNQFNAQTRFKIDDMNDANRAAYRDQAISYGMGMFQNAGDIGNFLTKMEVVDRSGENYDAMGNYKGQ